MTTIATMMQRQRSVPRLVIPPLHSLHADPELFFATPGLGISMAVLGGMFAFWMISYHPESFPFDYCGPLAGFLRHLAAERLTLLRIGFWTAWAVHALEVRPGADARDTSHVSCAQGYVALRLCRSNRIKTDLLWALQTFLFGYPSLRLLRKHIYQQRRAAAGLSDNHGHGHSHSHRNQSSSDEGDDDDSDDEPVPRNNRAGASRRA
jgi:hypothetical protein